MKYNNLKIFLFFLILFISGFLRFSNLNTHLLWQDEVDYLLNARNVLTKGIPKITHKDSPIENIYATNRLASPWNKSKDFIKYDNIKFLKPYNTYQTWLPFYIMAVFHTDNPNYQFNARIPAALLGTLLPFLMFIFLYKIIGLVPSFLLSLSISIDPFLISLSKEAYYHGYTIFFSFLCWYSLIKLPQKDSPIYSLFRFFSFLLVFHTNIKVATFLYIFWFIWTLLYRNKKIEWLYFSIASILCLAWVYITEFFSYFRLINFSQVSFIQLVIYLKESFLGQSELFYLLSFAFIASLILAFINWRNNKEINNLKVLLPIILALLTITLSTPYAMSYKRMEFCHFFLIINYFFLLSRMWAKNKFTAFFMIFLFYLFACFPQNQKGFNSIKQAMNGFYNTNGDSTKKIGEHLATFYNDRVILINNVNLVLNVYFKIETNLVEYIDEHFLNTGSFIYVEGDEYPLKCTYQQLTDTGNCNALIIKNRNCPIVTFENWSIYNCQKNL